VQVVFSKAVGEHHRERPVKASHSRVGFHITLNLEHLKYLATISAKQSTNGLPYYVLGLIRFTVLTRLVNVITPVQHKLLIGNFVATSILGDSNVEQAECGNAFETPRHIPLVRQPLWQSPPLRVSSRFLRAFAFAVHIPFALADNGEDFSNNLFSDLA
jgi:hypothetical protein